MGGFPSGRKLFDQGREGSVPVIQGEVSSNMQTQKITNDRRHSAAQADIMVTDDDDQSLKENSNEDMMSPSLVNKIHHNDSSQNGLKLSTKSRFKVKKKGSEGMITDNERQAVETITPIQISQVHIFKSSNLIHNRTDSKNFNNNS